MKKDDGIEDLLNNFPFKIRETAGISKVALR
jgi:hypothetical protein